MCIFFHIHTPTRGLPLFRSIAFAGFLLFAAPVSSAPPLTSDGGPAPYFGEIVIGNSSAYIGEVVPIELRFHYRADLAFDNLQPPALVVDRVINGPVSQPAQSESMIKEIPYNVVSFQSTLVPVAPGRVTIDSMMEGRMVSQGAMPGMDPFFDQFFRKFPMPGIGRAENIQARTEPRTLQVLALPLEGRPANFRGAVGRFTLQASAAPKQLKVGETAKFSVTVLGEGNFLAVDAASLLDSTVWKIQSSEYSSGTNGVHPLNSGGQKTFSIEAQALAPTATDIAAFAAKLVFFDPKVGQYQQASGGSVLVLPDGN